MVLLQTRLQEVTNLVQALNRPGESATLDQPSIGSSDKTERTEVVVRGITTILYPIARFPSRNAKGSRKQQEKVRRISVE